MNNINITIMIVKKLKLMYILLLTVAVVSSCSEYEMLTYENDPAIYFTYDDVIVAAGQRDSINHSFFSLNTSILTDTVWLKISTMGEISPQDRPVSIVHTNAGKAGAAVAGKHYLSFDNPAIKSLMVIPANKAEAKIPVVFLRDESLALDQVRLELAVGSNEYFRPGIDRWRTFIVTTTDQAVKPALWDSRWYMIYGRTWGSVKMRFIINVTGYDDWDNFPTSDISYMNYLRDIVAQAFSEYNRDHPDNPLKEANGDIVVFL
jgi:hypothetical protein